jgi:hypothetical protein
MSAKTVIVLVVILVLLHVLALAVPEVGFDLDSPRFRSIKQRLTRDLQMDDVEVVGPTDCLQEAHDLIVPNGQSCTFRLAPTLAPTTRQASFRLVDGLQATLRIDQPDTLAETCALIAPGALSGALAGVVCRELDVYRRGGLLEIACTGGGACRLRLNP